jgi:large subunit ribosomal protein L11
MSFCKEFNTKTKNKNNITIPVLITVYDDKSFTFIIKSPPTSILLKKAAGLSLEKKPGSGSKKPGKENVGKLTKKQIIEIGKIKLPDLNCINEEKIFKTISGTAKSIGISIIE